MESQEFTIYRPPLISHRLEAKFTAPKTNEWRPSLSYSHSLQDIQYQFTPAEYYRHQLATSGKYIRMIQRLETRWNRNYEGFTWAAIKVQAAFRGMIGRKYFQSVKQDLLHEYEKKQRYHKAKVYYEQQQYEETIHICTQEVIKYEILYQLQLKAEYCAQQYQACISTSQLILTLNEMNEDAYYLQATSWIQLNQPKQALDILKMAITRISYPSNDMFRLYGCIAFDVLPPQFQSAADSFTELIHRNPKDFDALFYRACAYNCMQNWLPAIESLNTIIAFIPNDKRALMFRARVFGCRRMWAEASTDYHTILRHYPNDIDAKTLLLEIQPFKTFNIDPDPV